MPAPAPTWDPAQYLRHAGPRARPFTDLLARVPDLSPSSRRRSSGGGPHGHPPRIADLGCGPGNVTVLLADRWPTARITGYDNSPRMLERAQEYAGPTPRGGHLDFAAADALTWTPAEPCDLVISNATLQWVPGHVERFADWIGRLAPGGVLAFQVPGNFDAPSHRLMRELAHSRRWRGRLAGALRHDGAVLTPEAYLAHLTAAGCTADVWETTYVHLLPGDDAVLDWVKGTGLRPVLTALDDDPQARDAFVEEYRTVLRAAYPAGAHGTPFPFRRIFAVARKDANR
ncbi:trans-aconitate 2-methyltransferase [Streptomyces pactum]|uniref:Trans-aconitate 2-methyltransferase n=1 Tax=Streptomyces pactum TaxID=68249 RepID=A0A1S6JBT1_9ACTN|nr:trans-aconitate 2-methyltransferase [Streptomyces pactum]AQS69189.1 trans-aconitate methyltransferase [Streptomyces pactum]